MEKIENKVEFIDNQNYNPVCFDEMTDDEYKDFILSRNKILKEIFLTSFVFGFIAYWIFLFVVIFVSIFYFRQFSDEIIEIVQWLLILVILVIIAVFKRKVFIRFFLDSRNAKKQIHELQVTDKQFTKHKLTGVINLAESQKVYYYLRLGKNLYIVKAEVYQNIEKGQVVTVHLSAQSKILLKIQPVGMHP